MSLIFISGSRGSSGYLRATPPEKLYHGTVRKFVAAILKDGLLKGERHHVHLSTNEATARNVGRATGRPGDLAREGW